MGHILERSIIAYLVKAGIVEKGQLQKDSILQALDGALIAEDKLMLPWEQNILFPIFTSPPNTEVGGGTGWLVLEEVRAIQDQLPSTASLLSNHNKT